MFDLSERELWFYHQEVDARLGLRGTGFEGGSPRPWDEARAASAHGFHVGEGGAFYGVGVGRTGKRNRHHMRMLSRVEATMAYVLPETRRLIAAAHESCGASYSTAQYFSAGFKAPLVGLGLLMWMDLKENEVRAPIAILRQWDEGLRTYEDLKDGNARRKQSETKRLSERVLAPVRRRSIAVYADCLGFYDDVRMWLARTRREEQAVRAAEIRRRTG